MEKTNKLGPIALILSIFGFVFALIGGILGWVLVLAGFILGVMGFTTSRGVGASTAAIIISVLGVLVRLIDFAASGSFL